MTPTYLWVVIGSWFVFVTTWLIFSAFTKHSYSTPRSRRGIIFRLVISLCILAFAWYQARSGSTHHVANYAGPLRGWIGATLAVIGIAIAVWARVYLGRNWGMPMTLRENHELVTSGPYAYVRHPIYTGAIIAMLGTALATSFWWAVLFVAMVAYFVYSLFQEEKDMRAKFPDVYPAYEARTTRLVPFIW